MAFTAEHKRELRKKKKEAEQAKKYEQGTEMLEMAPPLKLLKAPYKKKDLGKANVDYGGHQKALNFPEMHEGVQQVLLSLDAQQWLKEDCPCQLQSAAPQSSENRIGSLTIGLVYESGFKEKSRYAGRGKRKMCEVSEQYLLFLQKVREMLMPMLHPTLQIVVDETMRVNILCGAKTLAHTDSFRGNTPNGLYIVQQQGLVPGYLCYDPFPKFKYSLVKLRGKLYIPHSFSEASNECRCIGEHPYQPNKPYYYVFPASVIDSMEPHGEFDLGVVGWTADGRLQYVPSYEEVCVYTAPMTFHTMTWNEAVAKAKPVSKKPWKRVVVLKKLNTWMLFKAYMYRHWWVGNHMTLRYHVFFRSIREVPTSSNVNRKGQKINYVDARDLSCWKIHDRLTLKWSPIGAANSTIKHTSNN